MFKIRYFIYDSFKEKIRSLDLETFNEKEHEIYGTFEIRVNDRIRGFVIDYSEEIFNTEYEKKEFDSIWDTMDNLTFWINVFLKVSINIINGHEYIAFRDIESINWIELKKIENYIYMSEIEGEKFPENLQKMMVFNKVYNDNAGIKKEEFFKNEKIDLEEFVKEIRNTAKKFILDVKKINPVLLHNSQIKEIILNYINLKKYSKKIKKIVY